MLIQCNGCQLVTVKTKEQMIMSMYIPKDCKSINMNDLITSAQ